MESHPQLDFGDVLEEDEAVKLEEKRAHLRHVAVSSNFNTIQERVAWILNHYPDTRDSDITLQLTYWRKFESDIYSGSYIDPEDLYRLTRLTSLQRARAKIQNTYKLFQASAEIRRRRGLLEESETQEAGEQQQQADSIYAVYADESGKTQQHLVVGGVWFLHPPEIGEIELETDKLKRLHSFTGELHFQAINNYKLPFYKRVADMLATESSALSFKAISVPTRGLSNVQDTLTELYYLLLVQGIQHEHDSGRGSLPRQLQLQKDQEEQSTDSLLLANLTDRLRQASSTRFGNDLSVGDFEAVDSRALNLIQIADLFTSSVSRVLNATGQRNTPKDEFADYLLEALHMPRGPEQEVSTADMTYHIKL